MSIQAGGGEKEKGKKSAGKKDKKDKKEKKEKKDKKVNGAESELAKHGLALILLQAFIPTQKLSNLAQPNQTFPLM